MDLMARFFRCLDQPLSPVHDTWWCYCSALCIVNYIAVLSAQRSDICFHHLLLTCTSWEAPQEIINTVVPMPFKACITSKI